MSLRRFLNVAFALLVEEYQRLGVDLTSALEKLSEWGEGAKESVSTVPAQVQTSVVAAAHNESSMAALQGMLAGVQGAPTKKPRRTK